MELGEKIDALYELRAKRLELMNQVDKLRSEEVVAKQDIMSSLQGLGMAKGSGHVATAGIKSSIEPVVSDWDLLYGYILAQQRFDLLHRRISNLAWRELFANGILVPGTASMEVLDLSLTKSSRG